MAEANGVAERVAVRPLRPDDLAQVVRIDAHHTGSEKPDYWQRIFREFLDPSGEPQRIGLAADRGDDSAGYLFRSNRFRGGSFVQLERPLDGAEVKQ